MTPEQQYPRLAEAIRLLRAAGVTDPDAIRGFIISFVQRQDRERLRQEMREDCTRIRDTGLMPADPKRRKRIERLSELNHLGLI